VSGSFDGSCPKFESNDVSGCFLRTREPSGLCQTAPLQWENLKNAAYQNTFLFADDEFLLLGRSGMKSDKLKNGWSESGFRTYPFLARDAITE